MIKGAQKKMIVVKTAESDVFEEVYFVLRRESLAQEGDMVLEASRIIDSHGVKKRSRRAGKIGYLILNAVLFLVGALCGGGVAMLAVLL